MLEEFEFDEWAHRGAAEEYEVRERYTLVNVYVAALWSQKVDALLRDDRSHRRVISLDEEMEERSTIERKEREAVQHVRRRIEIRLDAEREARLNDEEDRLFGVERRAAATVMGREWTQQCRARMQQERRECNGVWRSRVEALTCNELFAEDQLCELAERMRALSVPICVAEAEGRANLQEKEATLFAETMIDQREELQFLKDDEAVWVKQQGAARKEVEYDESVTRATMETEYTSTAQRAFVLFISERGVITSQDSMHAAAVRRLMNVEDASRHGMQSSFDDWHQSIFNMMESRARIHHAAFEGIEFAKFLCDVAHAEEVRLLYLQSISSLMLRHQAHQSQLRMSMAFEEREQRAAIMSLLKVV